MSLNNGMADLVLRSPDFDRTKFVSRPGFVIEKPNPGSDISDFIPFIPDPPIFYEVSKLTHRGIVGYKKFENCGVHHHRNSLANLLNSVIHGQSEMDYLVSDYRACDDPRKRAEISNKAAEIFNQEEWDRFLRLTHQSRCLNAKQSQRVRHMSEKLAYYTQERKFKSKGTGSYKMRVAFITLTAPAGSDPRALCRAFNKFLDYLQRTANCYYVWKKELGEQSGHLHFHLIINNFVPYYIISWKWKRLLLAESCVFPENEKGEESDSHSRIELPRNKRQTAKYISKYLSKAYELPGEYGYIAGFSPILSRLKEMVLTPDVPEVTEIRDIIKDSKVIRHDYVTFVCCDLLSLKEKYPGIGAIFEQQYIDFSIALTLPQKFNYI
jgi:hypothetical protein